MTGATEGSGPEKRTQPPVLVWVIPLLVAVLLPGLEWINAEQPMAMHPATARGMTVWVALVALAISAVLSVGFRRRVRWALGVTTVAVLVTFHWPNLTSFGSDVSNLLRLPILADVIPVLVAWVFLWLATRLAGELPFATLLSVGTVAVAVILILAALPYQVDGRTDVAVQPADPDAPDVILLVLDGYARADVLEEFYALDNSPFLADLRELGFTIATEASPNYSFTYASISSMLAMDYVYDAGPITPEHHKRMRNELSGDAAIMRTFRERGYEVAFVESAWQGSYCGTGVDICVRDGHAERMLWNVGQLTVLAPLLKSVRPSPFSTVSQEHLESLARIVADDRSEGVPRLTIAHVLIPHPPLLLDADCDRHLTEARRDEISADPKPEFVEARVGYYAEQTICTNRLVLEQMSQILQARENTIVMITADHGAGSLRVGFTPLDELTEAEVRERMGIFSAYRVPGCSDLIYPSITPVNGSRAVATCALDETFAPLPDENYWIAGNGEGEAIPVAVAPTE